MVWTKEACKADTILFGKYRLERVIGTGRTGTVWLAVHLGLEEYRAIKQIPRDAVDYEAFRREALILKSLRHPAVPVIYDLEEDNDSLYLIEEYLQGNSLYALVKERGVLPEAEAIHYGIQISRLVAFLHSAGDDPILYLDLQPNNLLVCSGVVKIVDFGQAVEQSSETAGLPRYGTEGFAAPEQYTSDVSLDARSDIFAIGAVLSFMVYGDPRGGTGGTCGEVSRELSEIIRRCMEADRGKRFQTAAQAQYQLAALSEARAGILPREAAAPSLVIAAAASSKGAGATHLALGLCAFLTAAGIEAVYEERCPSGHMRCLAEGLDLKPDAFGVYHGAGCRFKPWYGEAVRLKPFKAQVAVRDYGTDWEGAAGELQAFSGLESGRKGRREKEAEAQAGAALLLAVGGSPWQKRDWEKMAGALGLWERDGSHARGALVLSQEKYAKDWLWGRAGRLKRDMIPFLRPYFDDPFKPGAKAMEFYRELWAALSGEEGLTLARERRGERWRLRKGLWGLWHPLAKRDAE